MKRLFDIVVATLALIVLALPLLLLFLFVRLKLGGPVLFRQIRPGLGGKPFEMVKFRTMSNARGPDGELLPDADRLLPIGRWMRSTSVDELPELWNVLKGDMSLVGPRPEMEFIVERYEPWQKFRLKAKPGLTGLWQILGRKDIPLHDNLEYDFYYVTNRCLILDVSILLKTVPAVLFGRGAY